jgi:DNA-binding NtrC family response regulator
LRVIQEREFTPLGDTTPRRVDVRIVAATNIDLERSCAAGHFSRRSLLPSRSSADRVAAVARSREDILPLAQHFIQKYNEENGRNVSEQLAPEVLALLEAYSWPGNVRELENTIERAVVIAPGDEITKECLRTEISDPKSVTSSGHHDGASNAAVGDIGRGINFYEEVRRFEIDLIRRALEQTGGHQSRAARLLGMNATTLNSKIKTYNINLRP